MENLPNELMDIDTEQQTIDNERERERVCSRERRRNQVSNSAQRDARLESERLRIREIRARENSAERNTRLEAERERIRVRLDHETPGP